MFSRYPSNIGSKNLVVCIQRSLSGLLRCRPPSSFPHTRPRSTPRHLKVTGAAPALGFEPCEDVGCSVGARGPASSCGRVACPACGCGGTNLSTIELVDQLARVRVRCTCGYLAAQRALDPFRRARSETAGPRLAMDAGTKADEIALALEEAIVSGELAPGSVLRQEQVSAQYEVSRTPVREALRRLAALGLVSFEANRGFRVRTLSRAEMWEAFLLRAELESLVTGRRRRADHRGRSRRARRRRAALLADDAGAPRPRARRGPPVADGRVDAGQPRLPRRHLPHRRPALHRAGREERPPHVLRARGLGAGRRVDRRRSTSRTSASTRRSAPRSRPGARRALARSPGSTCSRRSACSRRSSSRSAVRWPTRFPPAAAGPPELRGSPFRGEPGSCRSLRQLLGSDPSLGPVHPGTGRLGRWWKMRRSLSRLVALGALATALVALGAGAAAATHGQAPFPRLGFQGFRELQRPAAGPAVSVSASAGQDSRFAGPGLRVRGGFGDRPGRRRGGPRRRRAHLGGDVPERSVSTLTTDLAGGKTLAQEATAKGKTAADLITAIVEAETTHLRQREGGGLDHGRPGDGARDAASRTRSPTSSTTARRFRRAAGRTGGPPADRCSLLPPTSGSRSPTCSRT